MAISDRAKEITNRIYLAYGSDSGYLFGISPHEHSAVEAIVQVVLEMESQGGAQQGPSETEQRPFMQ